ncbi:hypothetical protein CJ671_07180 [Aliarcobacter cryaerophilus]|uniref:Sensor histidine kinase n=1 Tax=Aliarcobacter cryaerophilus TaxID=28198 RepID=A0A2S9SSL1_9BACT|nr:hypothetical protein [Aliarcobacter cryaerophilus]PRM89519.1 hypothetical protein CJ671_07180 [Aliarcobacter cryaerophilus]
MKKSYVLFITLILIVVFSVLANFILETNSLKNEAFTQKYLYLQAKNHILFLEDYILKTDLEDTKKVKIENDLFEIIAKRYGDEKSKIFFLSVQNKDFAIKLTKQIVKE